MAGQKPRLTFTPSPQLAAAIATIAQHAGKPTSFIVADVMEQCTPGFVEMAQHMEQFAAVRGRLERAARNASTVTPAQRAKLKRALDDYESGSAQDLPPVIVQPLAGQAAQSRLKHVKRQLLNGR